MLRFLKRPRVYRWFVLPLLQLFLINGLWRHRHMYAGMVQRSLQTAYAGTTLGWGWLYLKPLMMAFAYYFVFDQVLTTRIEAVTGTRVYALYLLTGLITWMSFSEGVIEGTMSLNREGDLLKKTRFPFEMIPARAVTVSAVRLALLLELVWLACLFMADGSVLGLVYLTVWYCLQGLLAYYLTLIFAIVGAALRDFGMLIESLFPFLLFFSPVLYQSSIVPERFRWVIWTNPFTPLVDGYHAILLKGQMPGLDLFLAAGFWIVGALLVANLLYRRARDQIVDWL